MQRVTHLDMKNSVGSLPIILLLLLASSASLQAQWIVKTDGLEIERINSVDFVTESVGLAVGDSLGAFKTTNGGEQWFAIPTLECGSGCTIDFSRIHFFNTHKGFVWGRDRHTKARIVLVTTDQGETWTLTDSTVADIKYISEDFGYEIGSTVEDGTAKNFVSITTDMGRTRHRRFEEGNATSVTVAAGTYGVFADSLNGLINGYVYFWHPGYETKYFNYFTTTGGKGWIGTLGIPDHYAPLGGGRWIGSKDENVTRSEDAGMTWMPIAQPGYRIFAFHPLSANDIYGSLGTSQYVAASNDGGLSWALEYVADTLSQVKTIERFEEDRRQTIYLVAAGKTWKGLKVFKQVKELSQVFSSNEPIDTPMKLSIIDRQLAVTSHNGITRTPRLRDILGRTVSVRTSDLRNGTWLLDLGSVASGIYVITLGTMSTKFFLP